MTEKFKQAAKKAKDLCCISFNKSLDYIKQNYKDKCFLMKSAIAVLLIILLFCFMNCNKQTITYHYINSGYIKEVREGSTVVKRQICFVDKNQDHKKSKYLTYYCPKELLEYSY